ncbi:MAG: hypothetical protein Q9214_002891 [Letrouitia sp. 1 TL-2023]
MSGSSDNVFSSTATPGQNQYLVSGEVQSTQVPWYRPSIPQPLQPHIQHFFESYVGLAPEEVIPHIETVLSKFSHVLKRAAAWLLHPYPCIGMCTFIHTPLYGHAMYSEILSRVKRGGIFLDVGTCFGQELRRLAADGAPGRNMYAIDLSSDFWELGYGLFRDRERLGAKLIIANILATNGDRSDLDALEAKVEVIHAGSFFHLFDWGDQAKALGRLVGLTRPGALVVGHQTGRKPAKRTLVGDEPRFYHDEDSFHKMWREVSDATGTAWALEVVEGEHDILGLKQDDFSWMGPYIQKFTEALLRL